MPTISSREQFEEVMEYQNDFTNYELKKGLDLSYLNLTGFKFVGATLKSCNLNDCQLQGADFSDADLSYASLEDSDLKNTIFDRADLHGAKLRDAKNLRFCKTDLRTLELRGVHLGGVDLSNLDLSGMDFTGASFYNTILQGTNLSNTLLGGVIFCFAKLQRANLIGADFEGSWPDFANVSKEQRFEGTVFEETRIGKNKGLNIYKLTNIQRNGLRDIINNLNLFRAVQEDNATDVTIVCQTTQLTL